MNVPQQEIWDEAIRLFKKGEASDLAHSSKGIFDLAAEAVRTLVTRYDCSPLALKLEMKLIEYFILKRHEAAHLGDPPPSTGLLTQ